MNVDFKPFGKEDFFFALFAIYFWEKQNFSSALIQLGLRTLG